MSRATLVIELSPGRLQAAVCRAGRLSNLHSVTLDPAQWEEAWKQGLRPFDAALRAAVAGAGAPRLPVTVLHHSPTCVAELFSCPSPKRSAVQAAVLALSDNAGFPLDDNPYDAQAVAVDRSGEPRQTHTLIAAETDEAATAITQWADRAGLSVECVTPISGAHVRSLLNRTLHDTAEGSRVLIRLGESAGHISAGAGGRLKLLRRVSLDIATLVEALMLPLNIRAGESVKEVCLSRDEARALLFRFGVPERDQVLDEARALTGAAVLPVLQPVLQRAVVEIRQSLRFGLDEPERAAAHLVIVGPGASIPRLGEVMAAQLALPTALPTAQDEHLTDLEDAARELARLRINLLPRRAAAETGSRRVRAALIAGSVLALVVGGTDAALTAMQVREARAGALSLRGATDQARRFLETHDRIAQQRAAIDAVLAAADKHAGLVPDWAAWLNELAAVTPGSVKLIDVSLQSEGSAPRCELRGVMTADAGRPDIGKYVSALQSSPLVAQVGLGATQRATGGSDAGREALDFQVTVTLVPLAQADRLRAEVTP